MYKAIAVLIAMIVDSPCVALLNDLLHSRKQFLSALFAE